jgi:hypothetical protein
MQLNGLPKSLTGAEPVTIQHTENGQMTAYTVSLSDLLNQINAAAPAWWVASLSTSLPSTVGVLWNNAGMLSTS